MSSRRPALVFRLIVCACLGATSALVAAKSAPEAPPTAIGADSADIYEDALRRLYTGDNAAAVIQFKNVLKGDPNNLPARIALGRAHLQSGDAIAAEKELRIALGLGAARDQVFPVLGNALIAQRKYAEVLDTIKPPMPGSPGSFEIQVLRGRANFELGQHEDAVSAFEAARKLKPSSAEPLVGLGLVSHAQSRLQEALARYDEALALVPTDTEAWYRKGEALRDLGRPTGAAEAFDRALRAAPKSLRVRLARGSLRLTQGDVQGALEDVMVVREQKPKDLPSLFLLWQIHERQQNATAAREDLLDLVGRLGQFSENAMASEPLLLRIAALVRYANRELARAEELLDRYTKLKPNDLGMRRLHGQVQLLLGEAKAAIATLHPLYRQDPKNFETLLALGQAYLQIGHYGEAGDMFEQARALAPDDPSLVSRVALSGIGTGDVEGAMSGLADAVEKGKGGGGAAMLLAVLEIKAKRPARAVEIMESYTRQAPRDPKAANLLGVARAAAADIDGARKAFESAEALARDYFPPIYNLARIELAQGDAAAAQARLEAVVAKDPRADTALMALADIALEKGDRESAVRWLDKAVAAAPQAVGAQEKLVDLRLALGQPKEALTVATRMVDNSPESAVAVESLARAEFANDKRAQAAKNFRDAARYAGFDGPRLMRIASHQVQLEEFDEARRTLIKATNTMVSDEALAALIRLEIQTGELDAADKRIAEMRRDDMSNAMADILSGELAMKRGAPDAAIKAYGAAQQRLPSTAGLLGLVDALTAKGDLARAIDTLEHWRKEHPEDRQALTRLALTYLPAQRLDEARVLHEQLLATAQDDPMLLLNLARLYQLKGDKRARATAEKALALAPESASALDTLGWILVTEKDTAAGLKLLRDALARQNNPLIRYHLAQALTELGRDAEARSELRVIIDGGQPAALVEDVKKYYEKLTAAR